MNKTTKELKDILGPTTPQNKQEISKKEVKMELENKESKAEEALQKDSE